MVPVRKTKPLVDVNQCQQRKLQRLQYRSLDTETVFLSDYKVDDSTCDRCPVI